jgi:hypothetical protein
MAGLDKCVGPDGTILVCPSDEIVRRSYHTGQAPSGIGHADARGFATGGSCAAAVLASSPGALADLDASDDLAAREVAEEQDGGREGDQDENGDDLDGVPAGLRVLHKVSMSCLSSEVKHFLDKFPQVNSGFAVDRLGGISILTVRFG